MQQVQILQDRLMYVTEDYDNALRTILERGVVKKNRTDKKTLAIFGMQHRYDLTERYPFITGRRIEPKAMIGELLWFLEGSTDNDRLRKLGCKFWTPWVDKEFEAEHGFAPGKFGPLYGFQLRHFGGHYGNGEKDDSEFCVYGKGGADQLERVLYLLKNNPDSRRILWSLWNPQQLGQMRLPPCHVLFQLFVHENKLSGQLYQRSCDFPVGVPFNIAFYSAMIHVLAQQSGLEPYEFVWTGGDCHIYEDQVEGVEEYLSRSKPDSPRLILKPADSISEYTPEHFAIEDYNPQPRITIPVAV